MILCFGVEDDYHRNIYVPTSVSKQNLADTRKKSKLELPNNQNPKSGPQNWIKPRSAVIIGCADPLQFQSESRIRAKIFTKSADP